MALTLNEALTGISGILVTPYDDRGDIAPGRLAPIIDRALAAGLHMPVVNGNTGEFYALTNDEAETMVREVVAMVDGRAPSRRERTDGAPAARRLRRAARADRISPCRSGCFGRPADDALPAQRCNRNRGDR